MFIRYLLLVLLLVFWVLALVGTLPLPLFSQSLNSYDQSGKASVTLWEIKTGEVTVSDGTVSTLVPGSIPVRINYMECGPFKTNFRAMQAFSMAGTIFGFYAFLISLLQCCCKLKVKLPLFIFVVLAFISELLLIILGAVAYTKSFCTDNKAYYNQSVAIMGFKEAGYGIGVSYILQIVACAGYLVCLILVPCSQQLWCGNK